MEDDAELSKLHFQCMLDIIRLKHVSASVAQDAARSRKHADELQSALRNDQQSAEEARAASAKSEERLRAELRRAEDAVAECRASLAAREAQLRAECAALSERAEQGQRAADARREKHELQAAELHRLRDANAMCAQQLADKGAKLQSIERILAEMGQKFNLIHTAVGKLNQMCRMFEQKLLEAKEGFDTLRALCDDQAATMAAQHSRIAALDAQCAALKRASETAQAEAATERGRARHATQELAHRTESDAHTRRLLEPLHRAGGANDDSEGDMAVARVEQLKGAQRSNAAFSNLMRDHESLARRFEEQTAQLAVFQRLQSGNLVETHAPVQMQIVHHQGEGSATTSVAEPNDERALTST